MSYTYMLIKRPTVPSTPKPPEKLFDPKRLEKLVEASELASATIEVLPEEIRREYDWQRKMLATEIDRMITQSTASPKDY